MGQTAARAIAENLLDRTGTALMTGDFALFGPCFRLPLTLTTFDETILIETQECLENAFRRNHAALKLTGATDLVRVVIAAEFQGPDQIIATHESHVMRHGNRLIEPYPVLSRLVRFDGRWLIDVGDYALESHSVHARVIMAGAARPLET